METLLLNKTDVGSLIDLDDVYKAVENGYRSFAKGHVVTAGLYDNSKTGDTYRLRL